MVGGFDGVREHGGGRVWIVSDHDGKNVSTARGSTSAAAWQAPLDQARAVGMAQGWRVSEP
jgi:hypothetical protein